MNNGRRGSVKQDKNGRWYFIVDIGRIGERKQTRRRGFPTRKAAQTELNKVLTSLDNRRYVAPTTLTLAAYLTDQWLPAIRHTIKPGTFESYRRNVRLHLAGRNLGRLPLQDVEPADLNKLYACLLAGDSKHRPLSPRSVAYIATILHRAMRDAVRWSLIVRNPTEFADPPRAAAKKEMRVWNAAQLATFLAHTHTDRLSGAWWLLANTGMRRGEVLGLRWSDIDLDAGRLAIRRTLVTTDVERQGTPGYDWGTPKTAKGWRDVALDPATVAALRQHRAHQLHERLRLGQGYHDQDLVICQLDGQPLHPKRLSYYFEKAIKAADLPRIRLHDLRHTHATLALKAGIHPRIVQERLGHANITVTLNTYSHVDHDLQAAAAQQIAELVAVNSIENSPIAN